MKNGCTIIAEIGVNHNGDMGLAKLLIEEAYAAGAVFVKFQTGKPENVMSVYAPKAEYQKKNDEDTETQISMISNISLPYESYGELKEYAEKIGIGFMSSPFDLDSIDCLKKIGVGIWKIPSGEITNYPYLVKVASFGETVFLSTGMSTLNEVERAICVLKDNGVGDIVLLHCVTEYPAPYEEVNLRAMLKMKEVFNLEVGYSDHTMGIEVPIAAVALGASVVEKHITLDRNMEGPDHRASIEPDEFKNMVQGIRNVENSLGDGDKKVARCEISNKIIARKSIVASKNIKRGDVLTSYNMTTKRPGNGLSPMLWNDIIGRKAKRDFIVDEMIEI